MRLFTLTAVTVLSVGTAFAQAPAYVPPSTDNKFDLRNFTAQSISLNGRWSSGNCAVKWYDWSVAGSEISFRDQSGKLDIERVVEVRSGNFITQSVSANHTPTGAFWSYQLVAQNRIRVQNLSNGTVFFQERCPIPITPAGARDARFGATIAPTGPTSSLGPSFSCDKAKDPLSSTICSDSSLSRLDREFSQAYFALRQQGTDLERQQLRLQAQAFQQRVNSECGLVGASISDPTFRSRAVPCISENYRVMRDRLLQVLSADARTEALRNPEEHVALQAALASTGFLLLTEGADGVYGPATRDAIMRFQQARSIPITGIVSAQTARELLKANEGGPISSAQINTSGSTLPSSAVPVTPPAPTQTDPPLPQRRPTPAFQTLAEEGQADDLLILANTSPDAPNAAINLSGQLTFLSGKAAVCLAPETELSFDDRVELARWFATRKVASIGTISTCREATLDKFDGILTTRKTAGKLETTLFNDTASRLQAGIAKAFVVISNLDRQSRRDRRELARASTEQAIAANASGYGYATISNTSATVCLVTSNVSSQVWELLLEQNRAGISLDLGRPIQPKPQVTDADTAYIGGRRGNCGLIIGNSNQLSTMFSAFQRDSVRAGYGAIWFSEEAVQNAAAALQAGTQSAAQAIEVVRQNSQQQQELRARREEAEGLRRERETRQLRSTFGANASALRDQMGGRVLSLFNDPRNATALWAASIFPELAGEAARRLSEGWTVAESGLDIVEYGRSKWSGRSLETEVTRIRLKLKNAEIGSYENLCFDFGYQNDTEFQRYRSAKSFTCKNEGSLSQWLTGLSFESSWNAP